MEDPIACQLSLNKMLSVKFLRVEPCSHGLSLTSDIKISVPIIRRLVFCRLDTKPLEPRSKIKIFRSMQFAAQATFRKEILLILEHCRRRHFFCHDTERFRLRQQKLFISLSFVTSFSWMSVMTCQLLELMKDSSCFE